jgi:hypothetical protein
VRVLEEVGVPAAQYPTMNRRLRVDSSEGWRESLAAACARQTWPPARSTTAPRDSIEAHLTIVFAALAVPRSIEQATGWSTKKFIKTVRHYRTIEIQDGEQTITAADPLPDDVRDTLAKIDWRASAHCLIKLWGDCWQLLNASS